MKTQSALKQTMNIKIRIVISILTWFFALQLNAQNARFKPFEEEGLYGIKKLDGTIVLQPTFEYIFDFYSGPFACFQRKKGLGGKRTFGIIDTNGKIVLDCVLYFCPNFNQNYFILHNGDFQQGLMSNKGKLILPIEYDKIELLSCGRFLIKKEGKFGFADENGKEVIPVKYDSACSFKNNLALVKNGDRFGYIDIHGNPAVSFDYEGGKSFHHQRAIIKKNGKFGLIDSMGNELSSPQFDTLWYESGRRIFHLRQGNKEGFMNPSGRWSIFSHPNMGIIGEDSLNFTELYRLTDSCNQCKPSDLWSASRAFKEAKKHGINEEEDPYLPQSKQFISHYQGRCVWVFVSHDQEYSEEGECAHTNGCTVLITRTLVLDGLNGEELRDHTDKVYMPNYE